MLWSDDFESLLVSLRTKAENQAYSWDTNEEARAKVYAYITEINHINIMLHQKLRRTILTCCIVISTLMVLNIITN